MCYEISFWPNVCQFIFVPYDTNWLSEYLVEYLPNVCKRYVGDVFLTSESYSGFFKLVDYMKHQHPNIKFIFEVEAKTNNFSFLDVKNWIENNTFTSYVFRKSTFIEVFTNFDSFIQVLYDTLIFWCFNFFFLWNLHNETHILIILLIFVL